MPLLAWISNEVVLYSLISWKNFNPMRQMIAPCRAIGPSDQLPGFPFTAMLQQKTTCVGAGARAQAPAHMPRIAPVLVQHSFDWNTALCARRCTDWTVQQLSYALAHLNDSSKPLGYITDNT
jgi:hypothetical protein